MKMMKITVEGSAATTSGTSAVLAIPVDSSGVKAEKVFVTVSGLTFILPGYVGTVATTSSVIVDASSPILLDVMGLTHIAYLEGTAARIIVVTPVD